MQPTFSDDSDQRDIGEEIRARQRFSSQRACPISKCKPLLYFRSLVRLAIYSDDWVAHHLHRQRALEGV